MKILMFFHGGSTNRGAEAIVRTAAKLFKENTIIKKTALSSNDPKSDQIIPYLDKIHLNKYTPFENYSLARILSAIKVKLFKDESIAFRQIHKSIIELIPKYDVFLSIGGDNYCYGEQPGIYEIDRQIKKSGKKLVLWGASIGKEDLSEEKLKDLRSFDLILARESITQNVLVEAGLKNIKLVADGAFLLEKEELPLPNHWQKDNTIGFNFSPLVYKRNPKSKNASIELIQYILKTTDATICLVPHVIQPNNNDYDILKEIASELGENNRVILLPDNLNSTEYKGYIARMKFFIGARTHATIAAYSSLVPTLVLGYSVKSKGISKDIFGEEKLVLNINEISNSEKLIEKFEEMKAEEQLLKETLNHRIPKIKKMAEKAAKFIQEL